MFSPSSKSNVSRARRFHLATLATHATLFWVLASVALCEVRPTSTQAQPVATTTSSTQVSS